MLGLVPGFRLDIRCRASNSTGSVVPFRQELLLISSRPIWGPLCLLPEVSIGGLTSLHPQKLEIRCVSWLGTATPWD